MIISASKTIEEKELVKRLCLQERDVLSYLYDHYSAALFGVIARTVRNDEIAEEVLQDVFMKIWNRIQFYDATKGKLFTWMFNIARNAAIDKIRSKEIQKEKKTGALDLYVSSETGGFTEQNIEGIGLRDLLKSLPKEQEFVVEHLYLKGYTQSELAAEHNIPLGTVKTRLRMAMIELRTQLKIN